MRRVSATLLGVQVFFIAILMLCAGPARSEYPEHPVTIIVAMDPGGPTDIMTRAIAPGAEKYLGKPFVIENKGGAGGAVALGIVANAKPDGYTLCATHNVAIVDTPLMQKVTFKPLKIPPYFAIAM